MKKTITRLICTIAIVIFTTNVHAQSNTVGLNTLSANSAQAYTTWMGFFSPNSPFGPPLSLDLTFSSIYVIGHGLAASPATYTYYGANASSGTAIYQMGGLNSGAQIRLAVRYDVWYPADALHQFPWEQAWDDTDFTFTPICATSNLIASASLTTICPGASVNLSTNGGSGGTITWTSSNGGLWNGSSFTTYPTVTTTYTATETNGSCTTASSITVTVNPGSNISYSTSANNVCPGTPIVITMNLPGNYTVTGTGTSTQYVTSPFSVNPLVSMTYTITGNNSAGCGSSTTLVPVSVLQNTLVVQSPSLSICNGGNVTLGVSGGGNSYLWTPSTGLSSSNISNPVATPSSTTTYTVIDLGSSCNFTKQVIVNVGFTPTVNITSSNSNPCSGSTVTLTATGANSYSWIGPNLNVLTGAIVTSHPINPSLYFVTGSNGVCSDTASILINVNQNSILNVNQGDTICSGGSAQLNVSGGTGLYTWSPGNYTGSSVTVAPNGTTTYTVSAANGSCMSTATVTITVIQKQNVNVTASLANICHSSNIDVPLTGIPAGGVFSGNGVSWNMFDPNIVGSTGYQTIYYTVNQNGCTSVDSTRINVLPSPVISSFTYSTGGQFVVGGYFPEPVTANIGNVTYTPLTQSTSELVLINVPTDINLVEYQILTIKPNNPNGCGISIPIIFAIGVHETLKDEDVKIFPNPFQYVLNTQLPEGKKYEITLLNGIGQEVRKFKTEGSFILSRGELATGLYVLRIKTDNDLRSFKVAVD